MAGMIIAGKNVFRISGFLRTCADFICAGNDIRESTVFRSVCTQERIRFVQFIFGVFGFSSAPYAWYVEMYIGLFLLIPFLNGAYHSLTSKGQKRALICTMIVIAALPNILNVYPIQASLGFVDSFDQRDKLLPSFWLSLYPIMYYFIGCYLREYNPVIKKARVIGIFIIVAAMNGVYNYAMNAGRTFMWAQWCEYGSFPIMLMATLATLFFLSLDTSGLSSKVSSALSYISRYCFGAYLLSFIMDAVVYRELGNMVPVVEKRFVWAPVVVLAVFIGSLCMASILDRAVTKFIKLIPVNKSKG